MGETMLPPMWSPEDRRQALVEAALQSRAYPNRVGAGIDVMQLASDVAALEVFIKEANSAS